MLFDLIGSEEFECSNTIPYCIKSKNKSCDFPYHQYIFFHIQYMNS